MNMKRLIWVTFGVYVFGGDSGCIVSCSFPKSDIKHNLTFKVYVSHLLLLGKFEYGGGPIFKVVLEC